MNVNGYKAAEQTLQGASNEAASLGAQFGVICRDGVFYIYNCREI